MPGGVDIVYPFDGSTIFLMGITFVLTISMVIFLCIASTKVRLIKYLSIWGALFIIYLIYSLIGRILYIEKGTIRFEDLKVPIWGLFLVLNVVVSILTTHWTNESKEPIVA